MAVIFSHAPGVVSVLQDLAVPASVQLFSVSPNIGLGGERVIATGIGVRPGANFQFQYSLNKLIYAYVFGDKMIDTSISGLLFTNVCESNAGGDGVSTLLDYYRQNKISSRAEPILITLGAGRTVLRAFLTDMTLQATDPEMRIHAFTLNLSSLPLT